MPFYEYECEKCKETFEALQKPSDPPLEVCDPETCKHGGGGKVKKIITGTNFHLYGPGFYSTDNKRKYLK